MPEYTKKDLLRGALKGELLEAKRLVTALKEQANPPAAAFKEAKALVRRLSINREFAFWWPLPDDDLDDYEERILKALLTDSRDIMRKLRKIVFKANGHVALDTSKVRINTGPAASIRGIIPPLFIEKARYEDLKDELLSEGWVTPLDFLLAA